MFFRRAKQEEETELTEVAQWGRKKMSKEPLSLEEVKKIREESAAALKAAENAIKYCQTQLERLLSQQQNRCLTKSESKEVMQLKNDIQKVRIALQESQLKKKVEALEQLEKKMSVNMNKELTVKIDSSQFRNN